MADRLDVDARDRPVASEPSGRAGWGRRVLTGLIALAAIGGFAVVVVYSYDRGVQSAGDKVAPIIKAQEGPTRVRPENPGGMDIPNQDKQIYDRLGGQPDSSRVEKLLPPPEPAVERPPASPEPPTKPAAEAVEAPAAVPEPPKAETAASPETAPPPAADKSAADAAQAEPSSGAPPAPEPEKRPAQLTAKAVAPPALKKAPPPASAWRVQIASLGSQAAADRAWKTLQQKHRSLFGDLSMRVERADVRGKTYYRVQAGPVASAEAARALCAKAKQRKIGCLVVRP